MRELVINSDKFQFIDILDVISRKSAGEHATFHIKGHIAAANDEYVLRHSAGQSVTFAAIDSGGKRKDIFSGLVGDIDIYTENDMRTLSVSAASQSMLMDIVPETRTFQDSGMNYQSVTNILEEKNTNFSFLWPEHGKANIGSMMAQYKETDWQFAKRLAGRIGTVVVPDYLLGRPYISIGVPKRSAKPEIDAISYTVKKDVMRFRDYKYNGSGGFSERDTVCYIVKSREIYDLCDPVPFLGSVLYVYSIDTKYEGDELVHYYTLKPKSGFYTKRIFNEALIGATLAGTVKEVKEDVVRVEIKDDVKQSQHKWFKYATPFSQPGGYGWYFMPETGDEIRLCFPSEKEHDAYVSSAVHITHGDRLDPQVKFIRTIYGQIIQFDPEKIMIDDGAGSSITMHKGDGISLNSNKTVTIDANDDVSISAYGKVMIAGQGGVVLQKNGSVVNIGDAIDISSEHTRIQ